jgi:hypothetical protein
VARASHRLRICILAADPDAPEARMRAAWDLLRHAGWLASATDDVARAVPGCRPLVDGGFVAASWHRADAPRFLANGTGGFHVRCPSCRGPLAEAFARSLAAWRGGAPRRVTCGCGHACDLADVGFSPMAGFARAWIALEDVASAALLPDADAALAGVLGGVRLVGQRG